MSVRSLLAGAAAAVMAIGAPDDWTIKGLKDESRQCSRLVVLQAASEGQILSRGLSCRLSGRRPWGPMREPLDRPERRPDAYTPHPDDPFPCDPSLPRPCDPPPPVCDPRLPDCDPYGPGAPDARMQA